MTLLQQLEFVLKMHGFETISGIYTNNYYQTKKVSIGIGKDENFYIYTQTRSVIPELKAIFRNDNKVHIIHMGKVVAA